MERFAVLAIVALVVMELLARAASRVSSSDAVRRLDRTRPPLTVDRAKAEADAERTAARARAAQEAIDADEPSPAAQGAQSRRTTSPSASASSRRAYLGSMGYESGEGESAMYVEELEDEAAGWRPISVPASAGDGLALPAATRQSGAIGIALQTLGDPHDAAHGAGAAIVLSEILGPPRAKSARRPSAPQARWR